MKNYEKFKEAVSNKKQEDYDNLKKEVKNVENAIEKFLQMALECTSANAEKDFFVSPM